MQAVLFLLIFESHQLDTFCDFDDTFLPAYEIPLILPADTMITIQRFYLGSGGQWMAMSWQDLKKHCI